MVLKLSEVHQLFSFSTYLKFELRDPLLQSKKVLLKHRLFLFNQTDLLRKLGVLTSLESQTALQVILHSIQEKRLSIILSLTYLLHDWDFCGPQLPWRQGRLPGTPSPVLIFRLPSCCTRSPQLLCSRFPTFKISVRDAFSFENRQKRAF